MAKIKLFGLLRIKSGITEFSVEAKTLKQALASLSKTTEKITLKEIKQAVTFVNGVSIAELKMFNTKLKAGDEVTLLSPVSGG